MSFKFILKNSNKCLLAIVFLFFSLPCISQNTLSIKGIVKNKQTNEVVPFSAILCKEMGTGTFADFQGFFSFNKISPGKHRFIISSVGYTDLDTTIVITKQEYLKIFLTEKHLTLDEIVVTAEKSEGLPTSSVIKQKALRHLQPNSFADILELMPGGIAVEKSMTKTNLIALRQPLASANTPSSYNEHNSSLGTAFVIDGIPLSNDAQLQKTSGTSAFSDYITNRDNTGKGIDMRMISTDDIEKVEIVRGIPSVKYGDLTSGLVKIERNYAPAPFHLRFKSTPTMKLTALGKGFRIGKHAINTNIDYIKYLADPRNEKVNYNRITASIRYANAKNISSTPLFFNASLDYTGSFDKTKRDEESDTKDESYKNEYNKVRFASKLLWHQDKKFFEELKLSISGSYTQNRKIINRIATGRMSPILKETKDGEFYGEFLPVNYPAHLELDGKPFYVFSRLHSQFHWDMNTAIRNNISIGTEWRFNKNFGKGEEFDINRPLFEGTGRPRRSIDIPAMQNFSLYAEDKTTINIGKSKLNAQLGIRATSLLNINERFSKLHNRFYFDPRANISFILPKIELHEHPITLTLHTGFGWHTKMPTLSHLYPNKKYYDQIQLNYYSLNKDLRQMQYKVKVIDPTNFNLKPNRNKKWELGISAKIGKIFFEIGYYEETMDEGFRHLNRYDFMNYKRYKNESGPKPSELTAPPTVDMFKYDSFRSFILYSQYTNGGVEKKKGIEYSLNLGNIRAIRSDVSINGAWMIMEYAQSLPRYSTSAVVLNDKEYPFLGYYNWDNSKKYEQFNTNLRFDTKIEQLGLIFSSTLQTIWYTQWEYVPNNGMPSYYIDKENKIHNYTQSDSTDPILKYLYTKHSAHKFAKNRMPITIDYNLKVSKRIKENIHLGFYVNRILYYYPDYQNNGGYSIKREASPYFGMELNIRL